MLRTLQITDLSQLLLIEQASQPSPWSEETFKQCLHANCQGWVVEEEGAVVGFIIISSHVGESHILNLCVHPLYQGRKLGFKLLSFALSEMKRVGIGCAYLEVRRSNDRAIALYRNMGFVEIGERKNYYPPPPRIEDALVFAKDLGIE